MPHHPPRNMRSQRCSTALLAALPLLLCLHGCKAPSDTLTLSTLPDAKVNVAPLPTYADLIARYNANITGLDRFFARTKVEVRWREDNRVRRESGDGVLAFERPLNTALSVEALGNTVLWAGSNETFYWLFTDLHKDGKLYFGQHIHLGQSAGQQPLPLPVKPDAVPLLLGLLPIDASNTPDHPAVELVQGYYLIEPPALGVRMLLDPTTARPVRVDLLDSRGRSAIVCRLQGATTFQATQVRVILQGQADTPAPPATYTLPAKAMFLTSDEQASMTLELKSATGDPAKVRPRFFDLEQLADYFDPEEAFDLDQP